MRHPKIAMDLSNALEVYDHYSSLQASETFKPRLARLCATLFHPYIYIEEPVRRKLEKHVNNQGQIAYAVSHASWLDVPHALAAVHSVKPLRGTLKRLTTPAKAPIFNNRLQAWVVQRGDGVPVIRDKDLKKAGTYNEATLTQKKALGAKVTDISIARADDGSNIAFFPEGRRRDRDSIVIGPIFSGLGRTACGSVNHDNFALVYVGIDYGEEGNQLLRPSVALTTDDRLGCSPDEVSKQVAAGLQATMDLAAAYNPKRGIS